MFLLLLLGGMPPLLGDVTREARADMVEINTCYTVRKGKVEVSYHQLIFWVHLPWGQAIRTTCAGYEVVTKRPFAVENGVVSWRLGGVRYRVRATTIVHTVTHTDEDPEVLARQQCPLSHRQHLFAVPY